MATCRPSIQMAMDSPTHIHSFSPVKQQGSTTENFDFPDQMEVTVTDMENPEHVCDLNSPSDQVFDDNPFSSRMGFCYPDENLMVDQTNRLGHRQANMPSVMVVSIGNEMYPARWTRAKAVTHHIDSTVTSNAIARHNCREFTDWLGSPQRQYRWIGTLNSNFTRLHRHPLSGRRFDNPLFLKQVEQGFIARFRVATSLV